MSRRVIMWCGVFRSVGTSCRCRSQALNRVKITKGFMPCITPQGAFWLRRRQRLACGAEKLRLQGVHLPHYGDLSGFSDPVLQDLAGNMFCAVSSCTVVFAMIASLPCKWRPK